MMLVMPADVRDSKPSHEIRQRVGLVRTKHQMPMVGHEAIGDDSHGPRFERLDDDALEGLEVGASIHISNVTLPKGSKSAIEDRDFTIATIVAPSALKSTEGDAETAGAEGEGEATPE